MAPHSTNEPRGLERVKTIVVLYAEKQELRSFVRHVSRRARFGRRKRRAENAARSRRHATRQLATRVSQRQGGRALPKSLPNGPFRADQPPVGLTYADKTPNPTHRYYQHIEQINGGNNNKFVAMSNTGAWTMAHYDGSGLKMWKWAREYALADHFFQGAFGGSYLNHQWLACACTPVFADAPASMRAQVDATGMLKRRASSPLSVMKDLSSCSMVRSRLTDFR